MRLLIQTVKTASVIFEDGTNENINEGLLVYVGISPSDTQKDAEYVANKLYNLRFQEDENGKMNLSYEDKEYEVLVISNFSLYGNFQKGNRPSFTESANFVMAEKIYNEFVLLLKKKYKILKTGKFRTYMEVNSVNKGPINLVFESKK